MGLLVILGARICRRPSGSGGGEGGEGIPKEERWCPGGGGQRGLGQSTGRRWVSDRFVTLIRLPIIIREDYREVRCVIGEAKGGGDRGKAV